VSERVERESRRERGFFISVMPALVYVVAIFYGGSVPGPKIPGPSFTSQDKLLHVVGFGVLQIAMLRAVRYFNPSASLPKVLLIAFALSALVGGALELWQMHIPNRSAELLDWIADLVGAGLVALAIAKLSRQSEA
jgi:VanZ family protein